MTRDKQLMTNSCHPSIDWVEIEDPYWGLFEEKYRIYPIFYHT